MNRRRLATTVVVLAVAALGAACTSTGGTAEPGRVPTMTVSDAYVIEPAGDTAAAYFTVQNPGDADVRLVGASSDAAPVATLHESRIGPAGVATMVRLDDVVVPAHGSVQFEPGGRHVMLEHVRPLHAGDRVQLTLSFAAAGTVTVTAPVRPLGTTGSGSTSGEHGDDH